MGSIDLPNVRQYPSVSGSLKYGHQCLRQLLNVPISSIAFQYANNSHLFFIILTK